MDGHDDGYRDCNGHAHPTADGHEDFNDDTHVPANGHENPNGDIYSLADIHENPNDTPHFANSYKRSSDALSVFANGHKRPSDALSVFANGHKLPQTDGHTDFDPDFDPDPDSNSNLDTNGDNGNKPAHQYACNHGDQLSHKHCGSDKSRYRNPFAHATLGQAGNAVANRPPDFNALGSCGHTPTSDGNRNPGRLESASKDTNPDRLEPVSKYASHDHYLGGVAGLPWPCGFGIPLAGWHLARCSWGGAGMAGLFVS